MKGIALWRLFTELSTHMSLKGFVLFFRTSQDRKSKKPSNTSTLSQEGTVTAFPDGPSNEQDDPVHLFP